MRSYTDLNDNSEIDQLSGRLHIQQGVKTTRSFWDPQDRGFIGIWVLVDLQGFCRNFLFWIPPPSLLKSTSRSGKFRSEEVIEKLGSS